MSAEEVARVRDGADAPGWSPRQALLLRAADELHVARRISDACWDALAREYRAHELIELCLLVGHYEMLAMTLARWRCSRMRSRRPAPPARARRSRG